MSDEERVSVKTYVPRYQKEIWAEHADELGMSQSEFVRTMVQAGRAPFEVPTVSKRTDSITGSTVRESEPVDPSAPNGERAATNGGTAVANGGGTESIEGPAGATSVAHYDRFEDRVVDVLDRGGPLDWDGLVDALIDDVEGELDAALERLQEANRVRHSGRDGGYVLIHE